MIASPADAACDELISTFSPCRLEVGFIESEAQLRQLWQIDMEAYGDHSLQFEPFLEWWQRYPKGSCIFEGDRIVASIGIYPLGLEQSARFAAGQICEADLQPITLAECQADPVHHWYFSGLVIIPEFQNRGLVRRLIRLGVAGWMAQGHSAYPLTLYGLGQTDRGRKALSLCGFQQCAAGSSLPDGLDLYHSVVPDAAALKQRFMGW